MFDQTIGAKVDWQEPAWPAPEKTWQDLWEFKVSETEPVIFVTAINDLRAHLESAYERVHGVNNWNTPTNTGSTIPAVAVSAIGLHVDFVCGRNLGIRPWLDELCRIRPTIIELFTGSSATAPALTTEPEAREVERPAASSRRKELEWLSSNTGNLRNYEGQWIAIEGSEIVACGSDEVEVEMQAREKGIKVPLLVRIPSKDDIPFVGSSLHDSNNVR